MFEDIKLHVDSKKKKKEKRRRQRFFFFLKAMRLTKINEYMTLLVKVSTNCTNNYTDKITLCCCMQKH